jgi:undecaprenyl diphosphate synthase
MTPATGINGARDLHVAIIMDGNGRWATSQGMPRIDGHRQGASVVRRVVETAPELGIHVLTLYAFSADNWRRPRAEIESLLAIFDDYIAQETATCIEHGIRFSLIGRRDRLPPSLRRNAEALEFCTAEADRLHLRLAIDYSARDAIWRAAQQMMAQYRGRTAELKLGATYGYEEFVRRVRSGRGEPADVPDVDLLIRTGGEQRLSDFLLWESAYAELWFTGTPWPEFTAAEFKQAVVEFSRRERRFGGLCSVRVGQ